MEGGGQSHSKDERERNTEREKVKEDRARDCVMEDKGLDETKFKGEKLVKEKREKSAEERINSEGPGG